MTLSENHIFSTSLLNSARFSFSRTNLLQQNLSSRERSAVLIRTGPADGRSHVTGLTAIGNGSYSHILAEHFHLERRPRLYAGPSLAEVRSYVQSLSVVHQPFHRALRGSVTFAGVSQFLTANLAGSQGYTVDPPGSILTAALPFQHDGILCSG